MKQYLLLAILPLFLFSACKKTDEFGNKIANKKAPFKGGLTLYSVEGDDITIVQDYDVKRKLVSYQNDKETHLAMWKAVTDLIPMEYRGKISQFEVFYGDDDISGYVVNDDENLDKWKFALAIDEFEDWDYFATTILHEYGHILTLNDTQITTSDDVIACGTYDPGEGCSLPDSYISALYNLGWTDIINKVDEDDSYELYSQYKNRFVSDYAATNPAEDIAEVFSVFVVKDKPTGNSIADQKIKLLYDFPELVSLRNDIRATQKMPVFAKRGKQGNNTVRCGRKGCKHL